MTQSPNPLRQFFRQPAIYIRLPSQGKMYPPGTIHMPENGEIAVYPMTAIDEITYQTPDALFNGEAVVRVIQSCVPNIRDAWAIPAVDLDTILMAIRIASYGHNLEVGSKCPECTEENSYEIDLRPVIESLKAADYSQPLVVGDLQFYFRSLDYREMTANNQLQFEQQKTLQLLGQAELTEEAKIKRLNEMMKKIVDLTITTMAESIREIRTQTSIVVEQEHILDFLENCERSLFNQIRDHVVKLREVSDLRPLKISCANCQHKYEQPFTLDMARFFGSAS